MLQSFWFFPVGRQFVFWIFLFPVGISWAVTLLTITLLTLRELWPERRRRRKRRRWGGLAEGDPERECKKRE